MKRHPAQLQGTACHSNAAVRRGQRQPHSPKWFGRAHGMVCPYRWRWPKRGQTLSTGMDGTMVDCVVGRTRRTGFGYELFYRRTPKAARGGAKRGGTQDARIGNSCCRRGCKRPSDCRPGPTAKSLVERAAPHILRHHRALCGSGRMLGILQG
jgi:hypothetical protein